LLNNFQFNEYEKIVIEDRNDKERAKRQAEQEQYELESTVKVCVDNLSCLLSELEYFLFADTSMVARHDDAPQARCIWKEKERKRKKGQK
jgi:hypothetical protein